MSAIWKYFTILTDDKNKARCDSCKKKSCPGGTTSGLKNQLKIKHKNLFLQFEAASTKPKQSQSTKHPAENDTETNQPKRKQRTIGSAFLPMMMLLIKL